MSNNNDLDRLRRDYIEELEDIITRICDGALKDLREVLLGLKEISPQQRWALDLALKNLLGKVMPDRKTIDDTQVTPALILQLIRDQTAIEAKYEVKRLEEKTDDRETDENQ